MLKLLILILSMIYLNIALSTTFVPISVKTQIKEAEMIVYGEVLSQDYEQVDDGMIATRFEIKLDKWLGMQDEQDRLVYVYTPGGSIGTKTFEVPGSAKLNLGEKVLLFLGKDGSGRFWIRNLGLGKYSAKRVGDSVVLVNQVFPFHPKMGQISMKYFLKLAQRIKGVEFKEGFKDKYEIQALKQVYRKKISKRNRGRGIASVQELEEQSRHYNPFWLVLILGLMGGGMAIHGRYSDK